MNWPDVEHHTVPKLRSIEWRLPLLISVLLVGVVSAFVTLAYREVERSRLVAMGDRLSGVAEDLALASASQTTARQAVLKRLAGEASVLQVLKGDTTATGAALVALREQEAADAPTRQVALYDERGTPVLVSSKRPSTPGLRERLLQVDSAGVGPIIDGDTLSSEGYVRVTDEDGSTLGFLSQTRVIITSDAASRVLSDLIGNDAALVFGNADGTVWTDLTRRVTPPPLRVLRAAGPVEYRRGDAEPVYGRPAAIAGTPWALVVEFPLAVVLEPARSFLRSAIMTGLLLVLLGTLIGFWFSRKITRPLASVTRAAVAIANGDFAKRVSAGDRDDEVGRLSAAFNTMAMRVQDSLDHLEEVAANLERSNQELEQFAYVASHDLQEPLRMVSSYVQLLASRYEGQLDDDADDFIAFTVDGAERMKRLIEGLLELSRVGRDRGDMKPVHLGEVLEESILDFGQTIEETGATITSDPLPEVVGDSVQLGQLLRNLIGNAIKFCDEENPEVHVAATRRGGLWVVSVRDNGIGFDPRDGDRIFKMFQRLHGRSEYGGTGIGLAICKSIVERHGGKIWVESAPGEGAEFFFTLPLRPSHLPRSSAATPGQTLSAVPS